MSGKSSAVQGNALWAKQPKANAELFALTYGSLVGELIRDLEKTEKIQEELDRMGHSMGIRCIEEFLAKSDKVKCQNFLESADLMKMALKMFLGITVDTVERSDHAYNISLPENPLAIFVELPEDRMDLEYSQLLCGLVRGMLEMLQFDVECRMVQSQLKGDDTNEISVRLNQILQDGAGEEYQEE